MSLYNDIRNTINRTSGLTLEHKRTLREISKAVFGVDQVPAASQAHADLVAAAGLYQVSVSQKGDVITTEILVDLAGLNSGGAGDVIGKNAATTSAAIFAYSSAVSGTLFSGKMETLETPVTGDTDVDLVISATGTTAEDAAPTSGTTLVNSGGIAAGDTDVFAVSGVAAKPYFYLVGATGGDATYTAGIVKITLLGTA